MDIEKLQSRKSGQKIVCLTAYTTPMAASLDAYVDLMLVGDSVGMVLYGMASTREVDLAMMCRHGTAVTRGANRAWVVVDMPCGTYEHAPEQAYDNANKIIEETGCHAVKLEGGSERAGIIAHLVNNGIPVLAHIGLLPQSSAQGYRIQGRGDADAARLIADARAVEDAGAFACVIEATYAPVAKDISHKLGIPTIGIGASKACDGQILVSEDMLGMTQGRRPRFVKCYSDLADSIQQAVAQYCVEVRTGIFPDADHVYGNED